MTSTVVSFSVPHSSRAPWIASDWAPFWIQTLTVPPGVGLAAGEPELQAETSATDATIPATAAHRVNCGVLMR